MARGWESKSVEGQIESADGQRSSNSAPKLTPEQLERQRRRESLELSRIRVLRDLEAARHPRRRELLQAALRHLEEKIAAVG
jgi:hypothetical protein